MTDQQNEAYVAALETERNDYLARGRKDRAAEVDAEIARVTGARPKRQRRGAASAAAADPDVETPEG